MKALTFITLLLLPSCLLSQGKLDQMREEVDRPASSSRSKSDDRCNDDSSSSTLTDATNATSTGSTSSSGSGGGLDAFAVIVGLPWVIPHMLLDPGLSVNGSFLPYPYASTETAWMTLDRERGTYNPGEAKWFSVRASIETGSDFHGLTRVGTRLFLDTDTRFGVKTGWDYYSEKLDGGGTDSLWIGDVMGVYRFVQNEQLQMYTGLGARFLLDDGRDRAGINFLYGFDAFPVEPVHLFGSFEAGNLRRAGVWRVQGGIGFNWQQAELFAGYDYLYIGGVELKGLFVGLRMWF